MEVCVDDNRFGPRVNPNCRPFDFTLLFEDVFFIALPAAILLVLLPFRLRWLHRTSVKVNTYRLAIWKLSLLAILFVLQVVFTVLRPRTSVLRTDASVASGILNILATFAAACASFLEDQRSVRPSDLLVVYLSMAVLCAIAPLRSLWSISPTNTCTALWTALFITMIACLCVESVQKARILRLESYRPTKEQICGFWMRSLFIWLLSFFRVGYAHVLQMTDIPDVDNDLRGQMTGEKLQNAWKNSRGRHRLLRATFAAYRFSCLSAIVPRLALSAFTFAQPFLITATVDYIGNQSSPESQTYGSALVGAYVLVYTGYAISTAVYWRQTYRFITMIRSGLISTVYDQTLSLRAEDLTDTAAITLMGTDVERIVASLRSFHEAWASILEAAIAVWLLGRQVWIACLVPLVIAIASVVAMVPISARSGEAQKQWIDRVQKRLSVVSGALDDIKGVHMLGLTDLLFHLISELRRLEVATSTRFRKLLIWQVVISNVPMDLSPFATFAIYAIISAVKHDTTLLSAQAFTSLALISLLTGPLLTFCQAMPALYQAVSCFDRIEDYLTVESAPSTQPISTESLARSSELEMKPPQPVSGALSDDLLASFQDATISKAPDTEAVFDRLTLDIRRGVTMILGPVGCGKSTLIESILGATVVKSGSALSTLSGAAYCSQVPWIQNQTIRQNIVGPYDFDEKWYKFTCWACGLENDLQTISDGDSHMAGSNGLSLSGGQKQRIALARVIYSRPKVAVLDDPFSGLDSKTMALISKRLFGAEGYFRTQGASVVLTTNSYYLLTHADEIIILDNGRVVEQGAYKDILIRSPEIATKLEISGGNTSISTTADEKTDCEDRNESRPSSESTATAHEDVDWSRQRGTWSVYLYYFHRAGYLPLFFFVVLTVLYTFSSVFSTLWLQWWVEENERKPNSRLGMYVGVYGLIFVVSAVSIILACWMIFVRMLTSTSLGLHADLLKAALRAPFGFFQTTDTGSTTNRFGQDMELIDMMLPIYAVNFLAGLSSCIIRLIVLCVVGRYLASSIPVLALVLFCVQLYYLRTSRQIRLLDIEAKAPLYSHFLETIQGITTIRAFGWQPHFQRESQLRLNNSQKPVYMLFCVQQWLTLVLDLVVGGIAIVLAAVVTSLKDRFSAASIGVALNLLLTFNQTITHTIKMWTMMEISIGAVSRVQKFVQDTPSDNRDFSPGLHTLPDMACSGGIDFDDVSAGHSFNETMILKGITLSVKPGQKVAVCGPSGSGKTSLIMALLGMLEIKQGRVLMDSRDLSSEQQALRANISVIPQDPLFLPGTARFNLDPHQRASDDQIEAAVQAVGLWSRICTSGGLDADFAPTDWSVGQKQLLALARTLVRKAPILLMDEATSSVDWETETIMQDIIDREFADQTIIAVCHRFRFIDRFDRVAVIQRGELVEYEDPTSLLQRDTQFRRLYRALQEPSMTEGDPAS
ncbi:P-loop containing nucleoside triphosphate hydrolase protein [Aspergillus coremiiformis]|uniref:P-loop containing nucleoside triphosphate hydrolase protein n=1 Tax=Aspergillus coremiiformis TaxID=138285 RepID=A0A5N6Z854_9EURO|nr:P-loop containing nucleoside triphosphate hydrolase protein [Aspergillus coremiiformis]